MIRSGGKGMRKGHEEEDRGEGRRKAESGKRKALGKRATISPDFSSPPMDGFARGMKNGRGDEVLHGGIRLNCQVPR